MRLAPTGPSANPGLLQLYFMEINSDGELVSISEPFSQCNTDSGHGGVDEEQIRRVKSGGPFEGSPNKSL